MNVLDIAKQKRAQLLGEIERLDNFLKTAVELEAIGSSPNNKRRANPVVKTKPAAPKAKALPKVKAPKITEAPETGTDAPKTAAIAASRETQPIPDGEDLAVPDYRLHQDEFSGSAEPNVQDMKIEAKPNADQITFQYPFNSALFQKILAEHRERHGLDSPTGKELSNGSSPKQAAVV